MSSLDLATLKARYERDGFVSGVRFVPEDEAAHHRAALEIAETEIGAVHYKPKIHTVLRSPYELATLPQVLDVVEQFIGPNILLHNVTYIIKEPRSASHVSWHQDLTYWGFSADAQVSMWLALSLADEQAGCMRMIPKSHRTGNHHHTTSDDETNVLFQSQTVENVNEDDAVLCPLNPGEASFHHGRTLHASMPNQTHDRRIGLNVQYLAPHMKQMKHDDDTALLVRGEDRYNHFGADRPAATAIDTAALKTHKELEARYVEIASS